MALQITLGSGLGGLSAFGAAASEGRLRAAEIEAAKPSIWQSFGKGFGAGLQQFAESSLQDFFLKKQEARKEAAVSRRDQKQFDMDMQRLEAEEQGRLARELERQDRIDSRGEARDEQTFMRKQWGAALDGYNNAIQGFKNDGSSFPPELTQAFEKLQSSFLGLRNDPNFQRLPFMQRVDHEMRHMQAVSDLYSQRPQQPSAPQRAIQEGMILTGGELNDVYDTQGKGRPFEEDALYYGTERGQGGRVTYRPMDPPKKDVTTNDVLRMMPAYEYDWSSGEPRQRSPDEQLQMVFQGIDKINRFNGKGGASASVPGAQEQAVPDMNAGLTDMMRTQMLQGSMPSPVASPPQAQINSQGGVVDNPNALAEPESDQRIAAEAAEKVDVNKAVQQQRDAESMIKALEGQYKQILGKVKSYEAAPPEIQEQLDQIAIQYESLMIAVNSTELMANR